MKPSHRFWWGVCGAILPELVRFFKLVSAGSPLPNLNWPLYLGIFLVYAAAAGLVTVAWEAESAWKALWVGASFPALVATLFQAAPSLPH